MKRMKRRVLGSTLLCIGLATSVQTHAGSVETLQLRDGVTQNILILKPAGPPKASVVLFAGGDGEIGISKDGSIENDGNFLVHNRNLFVKHGFLVAVFDMPNENRVRDRYRISNDQATDGAKLIARLRTMASVPVWLVGTSRGSISAAQIAAELNGKVGPDGVVFTASATGMSRRARTQVDDVDLEKIKVPSLIVHHKDDECYVSLWSQQDDFLDDLKNAAKKQLIGISGGSSGSPGDECSPSSHHGFLEVEEKAVQAIAEWIKTTP